MKHSRIAVFDIDGTLFRSSLLIELSNALIREGIFDKRVSTAIEKHYVNWKNRNGAYSDYIASVVRVFDTHIEGKHEKDLVRVSREVVRNHKSRVYVYTRELIEKLRRDHILIAISGSPIEMVHEFNRFWKFDYAFGGVHELEGEIYTGEAALNPADDKKALLEALVEQEGLSLSGSIGVGDTESDVSFLEMVSKPICFNPNAELYATARRNGWQVIVERKDVVYKIV